MAARSTARAAQVYAIVGEDSYLAESALADLLETAIGGQASALQALRGDETTWVRLLDAARSRSLFAERRALVVRGAEGLKGSDEGLARFLDAPNPDVTLVLLAAKVDRRKGAWRLLNERAQIVSAEPLKGRALRARVVEEVRRRQLLLGEDGLDELIERVGQDLRRLVGEVEKLQAYAGRPGARLSADDVAAVLGRGLARPLYKVSDALWARRGVEVLELVAEILADGEPAQRVLATLHRALRQIRGTRALLEAQAPRDVFAQRLGLLPFKVNDAMEAARRWSSADLERAARALAQADRRLKTGTDAQPALAAAIVEACGIGAGGVVRPAPRPAR